MTRMKGDYPSTADRAKTIDGAQALAVFKPWRGYYPATILLIDCLVQSSSREPMQDADLRALTTKLELLILRTEQLKTQNRQLLASANEWRVEREQLIEKNQLARSKVESMIIRLKDLEQSS